MLSLGVSFFLSTTKGTKNTKRECYSQLNMYYSRCLTNRVWKNRKQNIAADGADHADVDAENWGWYY